MSPVKEPCYFASELRIENICAELRGQAERDAQSLKKYLRGPMTEKRFGGLISDWDDYLRLFAKVGNERAIGEASVCYLWSETAAANIHTQIPHAKIIMILRDPAERAFSQYLHAVSLGMARGSFGEYIRANLGCTEKRFGPEYPILEFGLYYEQIKRYLAAFAAENVRIYLYEDYTAKPEAAVADVFRFLDVDEGFIADIEHRHMEPRIPRFGAITSFLKRHGVWERLRAVTPPAVRRLLRPAAFRDRASLVMDAADRVFLVNYYEEDIRRLSILLDRDVSSWLVRQT